MKKVLILAYDFPPYVSVGGLRPFSWYNYLKNFDIEPIVITRQWENKYGNHLDYVAPSSSDKTIIETSELGTIIRTPYKANLANRLLLKYGENKFKIVRKSVSLFFEITQFLSISGPKKELFYAADSYLRNNKIDVIIATGEPFVLFKYGSKLSRKYNIPWIADYRDPWSMNLIHDKKIILKSWYRYLEKKYVSTAYKVTTVSDFFKLKIQTSDKSKIYVIPNGFDPQYVENTRKIPQESNQLSIALIGTTYQYHPVEVFLKILNDFNSSPERNPIQLNLFGVNNSSEIMQLIQLKFPFLIDSTKVFPRMKNEELLKSIATNNIMLLFNYYSIIGTKIYDYIGINRQILFCFSDDPEAKILKKKYFNTEESKVLSNTLQQDLIEQKNAGIIVKDSVHLKKVLGELYHEFEKNRFIKCATENSEEFSRKNQAGKLAKLIK